MASIDLLRFAALCVTLAGAETLHGIARTVLLAPRVGKARALQISGVTGTLLAFGLCYVFVPALGARGAAAHLVVGLGLAGFMAAFDIAIGRLILRFTWARIGQDFRPSRGNYLSIGLALLALIPTAVWWLKGPSAP